jgi:hypothetical protein
VFARGGRVVDYDVSICCSVYGATSNANGWLFGAGFGFETMPVGPVRFDLSAGVNHLSGQSRQVNLASWKSAGPVVDLRLGASLPLVGRSTASK